ncbi:hypothetical protein MMC12_003938 [Toensbergia leucococca]|nr:hypothetical protein [Toensbergia leucococca]
MAEQTGKDEAAKLRIINHMNLDHQDSLVRYLEHFCNLSSFSARNAKLVDIAFDSLVITSNTNSKYTIPIEPPMTSWPEARPRVVAMDSEAVAGLNRSSITVKKYKRPKGFMAVVFIASACTFVAFSKRSNFLPGSWLYDIILKHVPDFAQWCHKIQPLVIYPMLAIHGSETVYLEKSRLQKHNVPRFSKLWWKWVLSTFLEGFGAFVRIDRIVKEEEAKKAKAKH